MPFCGTAAVCAEMSLIAGHIGGNETDPPKQHPNYNHSHAQGTNTSAVINFVYKILTNRKMKRMMKIGKPLAKCK